MSPYQERIIEEIINMIRDNIKIYYRGSDNKFKEIRKISKDKYDDSGEIISHQQLSKMVQEVLCELLKCDHLYDFRLLE